MLNRQGLEGTRTFLVSIVNVSQPETCHPFASDWVATDKDTHKRNVPGKLHRDPVHATPTRPRPTSRPLYLDQPGQTQIMNQINEQSDFTSAWVHFFYNATNTISDYHYLQSVIDHAWAKVKAALGIKTEGRGKMSIEQQKRIKALLLLACYDVKHRILCNQPRLYTSKQIKSLGNFTDSSWRDRWRERWNVCIDELLTMDTQAITRVNSICRAAR